jgi:hypothetical protein
MGRWLLTTALLALASPAAAGPPSAGFRDILAPASILCDTTEQLTTIFTALEIGPEEAQTKYIELYATLNDKREPTCAVTIVRRIMVGESTPLGRVEISGATFQAWSVHVTNARGEGFYLHLEQVGPKLSQMI